MTDEAKPVALVAVAVIALVFVLLALAAVPIVMEWPVR